MKGSIVVYKSKSGSVKKYAQWIAEEINAYLAEASSVKIDDLLKYDTIVYGGGLYVGGINGVKLITKNFDKLKDKKIVVFASGASPVREDVIADVKKHNFTQSQSEHIKFYMLRGGFDFSKCTFVDKFLMMILKVKIKSNKNPSPDEIGMLECYGKPADWTNKKYIEPIINDLK